MTAHIGQLNRVVKAVVFATSLFRFRRKTTSGFLKVVFHRPGDSIAKTE